MSFLKSLNQIREVEWGRTYFWDIKFIDNSEVYQKSQLTSPFDAWFPAVDIDENVATLDSFVFEGGRTSFKVPARTSPFELKITFLDDENYTLLNWIRTWINEDILKGNTGVVATLEEAVKIVKIVRMRPKRRTLQENLKRTAASYSPGELVPYVDLSIVPTDEPRGDVVETSTYIVYPDGPINFAGNSNSEVPIYTVNFNIVGGSSERDGVSNRERGGVGAFLGL